MFWQETLKITCIIYVHVDIKKQFRKRVLNRRFEVFIEVIMNISVLRDVTQKVAGSWDEILAPALKKSSLLLQQEQHVPPKRLWIYPKLHLVILRWGLSSFYVAVLFHPAFRLLCVYQYQFMLPFEWYSQDKRFLFVLTVCVDFIDQFLQCISVEGLTHEAQDLLHHIGRDASWLLAIKSVECLFQHCNKNIEQYVPILWITILGYPKTTVYLLLLLLLLFYYYYTKSSSILAWLICRNSRETKSFTSNNTNASKNKFNQQLITESSPNLHTSRSPT